MTLLLCHQKRVVFQQLERIQGLKNSHRKRITLRNFATQRELEQRKKGQQLADMMAEDDQVERVDISTDGKKIFVGEMEYQKKVVPPDPTQVLRLPLSKLNQIMATQIDRANAIMIEGNTFVAYSLCTTDFEKINDAYMKLRLNHAEAKHIVCAWNIPGPRPYESVDCCDDNDHGVGYNIQKLMMQSNITHRVIYVVRNMGKKLNEKRIPSYVSAVKKLMEQFPTKPC